MRASASPVGSVESTWRCRTWGLMRLTRPARVPVKPPFSLVSRTAMPGFTRAMSLS